MEFVGARDELRSEDIGPEHYKADEIGISLDSIHTYLAINDDFYNYYW
jgi:hypothetical protein